MGKGFRVLASLLVLSTSIAVAATKPVDLDGQAANGDESACELNVLSSFPVRIQNVVRNRAVGTPFDFRWKSAGPAGFTSSVTPGTTGGVGAIWEWTTNETIVAFTGSNCDTDICFLRTGGTGPAGTCSLGCLNDGVSLTTARGTGGTVLLNWGGGTAAYGVYRSTTASTITAPTNLLASTSLFQYIDTPPVGGIVFYRVRASSCVTPKPCSSDAQCVAASEGVCVSRGPFSVPGRTLSANSGGITVSSASLTSSLITFFSPQREIFRATSTALPGGAFDTVFNPNDVAVTSAVAAYPPGCCPAVPGVLHQFRCGETCVDVLNDPENCGACGNVCGDGTCCSDGECVPLCGEGREWCDGQCVDVGNDSAHCGTCGNACGEGTCCSAGGCESLCELGRTYCDGLCFDLQLDPQNCGACGNVCDAGSVCDGGACIPCGEGQTVCANRCVSLASDPYNCGSCGNDCNEACPPGTRGVCGDQQACLCAPGSPGPAPLPRLTTPTEAFCRNLDENPPPVGGVCPESTHEGPIEGEAPTCVINPSITTIPPGGSSTVCRPGGVLFKEIASTVSVCGDSIPGPDGLCQDGVSNVTTGTFMQLVPDTETEVGDAYLTPYAVQVTGEPGRDGLLQPEETGNVFVSVLNAGPVNVQNASATLVSNLVDLTDNGIDDPVRLKITNATQSYGTILGTAPTENCEPPVLHPAANATAFRVEAPYNTPADTVFPLQLLVTGTVNGLPYSSTVPLAIGIADNCDYDLHARDYDGIDGLLNPMTKLVPDGDPVPFPGNSLNAGSTAPLKMRLLCGGVELKGADVDAPQIVGLSEATRGPIDIESITLDADTGTNNPFFRYNETTKRWIFNMRTDDLDTGVFTLTIRIAGRKDYVTGFELD